MQCLCKERRRERPPKLSCNAEAMKNGQQGSNGEGHTRHEAPSKCHPNALNAKDKAAMATQIKRRCSKGQTCVEEMCHAKPHAMRKRRPRAASGVRPRPGSGWWPQGRPQNAQFLFIGHPAPSKASKSARCQERAKQQGKKARSDRGAGPQPPPPKAASDRKTRASNATGAKRLRSTCQD